jgi:NADH dehydrogenase
MTTQLEHRPASGGAPRVVVVGAGFGGLAAARRLARAGAETTLIDRNVYSTFQPLLYQLATGGLASSDVAYPVRAASRRHGMLFRHGELAGIDPAARQVTLADGATPGYDYLILATGVAAAYHGVPGAAEHSLGLYTRHDAIVLRDRIMAELDWISLTGLREDVAVTVIGGGATGVELAGSLADLRGNALPAYFPEVDPARVHITLVEHGPVLLAHFHPALRDYSRRQLAGRGVQVRLGATIAEITPGQVMLADGTALPSDITIWAAGVTAPDAVSGWGLPQAAGGRILTGPDLRVVGQDRIFAIGDIALIDGQPLPQLAQPARQMGKHVADQIRRLETRRAPVPFRYHDKGIMATIGYRSAVVQLPHRVRIRGTAAWLAWLALHLIALLGGRNQISALVNLSWRYLNWRHGGGGIIGDRPPASPGPPNRPAATALHLVITCQELPEPANGRSHANPRNVTGKTHHGGCVSAEVLSG